MNDQWLGKGVDLNCGPLGVFQGIIDSVHLDEQTITIKNVIHNGMPSKMSSVTIEARDIKNIEFVETTSASTSSSRKQATVSTITVAKKKQRPVAESLAKTSTVPSSANKKSPAVFTDRDRGASPRKNNFQSSEGSGFHSYKQVEGHRTPNKRHQQRDEDCFGVDVNMIHKDFDFERNLALFNKQLVFEQIESNQPDVVRLVDHNRRTTTTTTTKPKSSTAVSNTAAAVKASAATAILANNSHGSEPKYRNDQNVLAAHPTEYKQISSTEEAPPGEYLTDTGLVIPAASLGLRERLVAAAEARGISKERLTELVARASTELSMQLLGGSRRLNPTNSHQAPYCVVLCGPGRQGAYGLATARHLAGQGIRTLAYLPDLPLYPPHLASEWTLYKLCCKGQEKNKWTGNVKDLPTNQPIDLVVMALDDHEIWEQERGQPWHKGAIKWTAECRAPVLAIDPLATPLAPPVLTKASLVPGPLPLWHEGHSAGKVYLVNLAIPNKVYRDVGVHYTSPFGDKTYLPLDSV